MWIIETKSKDEHSLIKLIDHVVVDDFRTGAVQLHDLLDVRIVGVDRSELHSAASEEDQEVLTVVIVDLLWGQENRINCILLVHTSSVLMWHSQISLF